jgi:hypothetical protein
MTTNNELSTPIYVSKTKVSRHLIPGQIEKPLVDPLDMHIVEGHGQLEKIYLFLGIAAIPSKS